mmetsp:Transcript_66892/g.116387  ORF Transcript_66892/g.116387 Transcript_66892/m.116387 type:complete len:1268 (+) Transcript_66892:60-3863(+)
MAPVAKSDSAKRLFKFVSGVFNGAFSPEKIHLYSADIALFLYSQTGKFQLVDACDALAVAIDQGYVPEKGQGVLKGFQAAFRSHNLEGSSLHKALGFSLDSTDEEIEAQEPALLSEAYRRQSVKRMFKCVSGILNGAFTADQIQMCSADVPVWCEHGDLTFSSLCDSLAAAIDQGYVPQKGQNVLKDLALSTHDGFAHSSLNKALGISSNLLDEEVHVEDGLITDDEAPAIQDTTSTEDRSTTDDKAPAIQERPRTEDCLTTDEEAPAIQEATNRSVRWQKRKRIQQPEVAEAEKPAVTMRLFKCVAGILNGAFPVGKSEECSADMRALCHHIDPTFENICDALAAAIDQEYVADQGLAVLRNLAPQMRDRGLTSQSRLALSLKIDLDKVKTTDAARRIFAHVKATLEGKCPEPLRPEDIAVWHSADDGEGDVFKDACDALAAVIEEAIMPAKALLELCDLAIEFTSHDLYDSHLHQALMRHLCPECKVNAPCSGPCTCRGSGLEACTKCKGSGKYKQPCRGCDGTGKGIGKGSGKGTGRYCPKCDGTGQKVLGECRECEGSGLVACLSCRLEPEVGLPRRLCTTCADVNQRAARSRETKERRNLSKEGPPQKGVSIEECAAGDLSRLQDLWTSRGGPGDLKAAWKVDNPLLTYKFKKRREVLRSILGREADILEGFHGTASENVLSIIDTGFDKGKRGAAVGQVHGSGEYFAKDPTISLDYCRGGEFMLVCRLTLGLASTYSGSNQAQDGDHVWVPHYGGSGCYVIAEPDQILPQFIVQFTNHTGSRVCPKLGQALQNGYSTKPPPEIVHVPNQRPCVMSREAATVLWMGFLHAHFSDDALRKDVLKFLETHAAPYLKGAKIQIVKGNFKKAHAILQKPMPRAMVHKLNSAPFIEQGSHRTICVEDAHGSPGQRCPRYIAGFCRGQNLRHTHPCFCSHPPRATHHAHFRLEHIDLDGAKGTEIRERFMASAPFHNGHPSIVSIKAIKNDTLSRCHEEYRKYLNTKHMDEPAEQELYHGTNNNILDVLYKHGLQPPSDCDASDACPVSGGKGLCTTLCDNTCVHCTEKHQWNRCHMYGLGIYLADMAQKSHRYVSQPKTGRSGRPTYRMIVCSVLGKSFQFEGHLKDGQCMHDVVNVRALDEEELDRFCEPCTVAKMNFGIGASIAGMDSSLWGRVVKDCSFWWQLHNGRRAAKHDEGLMWKWCATEECSAENREGSAEKSDLIFIKGLGDRCRPGYSVFNSEYIAFHPHQCLPKYEIEYEIKNEFF